MQEAMMCIHRVRHTPPLPHPRYSSTTVPSTSRAKRSHRHLPPRLLRSSRSAGCSRRACTLCSAGRRR